MDSIHSACFCFKITVTIIIDGSIKPNRMLGFDHQSLHVIERCSKIISKVIVVKFDFFSRI